MLSGDRLEFTTDENFDASAYVAAAAIPPRKHFEAFGKSGRRRQIVSLPKTPRYGLSSRA